MFIINLYKYNLEQTFKMNDVKTKRTDWLKTELEKVFIKGSIGEATLLNFVIKLYEKYHKKNYYRRNQSKKR